MPDMSQTSELEAVNAMLATIGESPVETLEDSGSVDVEMARQILARTSRRVQERGWSWNTAESLKLLPDTSGNIPLPENTLKVETCGACAATKVAKRGTRLYNRTTNSYAFTAALTVTLVEFLGFDELPEVAAQYIAMAASRVFQAKAVGSAELSQEATRDEQMAWVGLFEAEADTANFNVFTSGWVAEALFR